MSEMQLESHLQQFTNIKEQNCKDELKIQCPKFLTDLLIWKSFFQCFQILKYFGTDAIIRQWLNTQSILS